MHYQKIIIGKTFIEFHNNWLGEESVVVNGQVVSKKASVWGAQHYFTVIENGHTIRYILTSKADPTHQVYLDLRRNGELIKRNIPVPTRGGGTTRKRRPRNNPSKHEGLAKLKEYELDEAVEALIKAAEIDPQDSEVYFHLACAYSVLEKTKEGYDALRKAKELGLKDDDTILKHDMLAYLRIQDAFEDFLNSGFTAYDPALLDNGIEGV